MLERLFGKKEPVEQGVTLTTHFPAEMRNALNKAENHAEAKAIADAFFSSLSRVEILLAYDKEKEYITTHHYEDSIWEAYFENKEKGDWPLGDVNYENIIPDIIRDEVGDTHAFKQLRTQVDGMQKKLDMLAKLIENVEFCADGKTLLKL